MWIFVVFLLNNLMFINTFSNDRLVGDNICLKVIMEPVETVHHYELKNRTIRTYKWCMNIPPRCSQYEMKTVNEPITKEMNISKSIEVCCDGYERVGNKCVSLCSKCVEGFCFHGKCLCDDGWIGIFCDTRNLTTEKPLTIDYEFNYNPFEWLGREKPWNPNSTHYLEYSDEEDYPMILGTSRTTTTATIKTPATTTTTTVVSTTMLTTPTTIILPTSSSSNKNSVDDDEKHKFDKSKSILTTSTSTTNRINKEWTDESYGLSTTDISPLDTTITQSIPIISVTTPIGTSMEKEQLSDDDDFHDNFDETDYREIGGESIEITAPSPINFSEKPPVKIHEISSSSESYDNDVLKNEIQSSTTIKNNQDNNKHLFYIISIILFVMVVLLVIIATVYLLQNGKKRSQMDNNSKGKNIGYSSSIFHTPLPDPPISTFDNPTYMAIREPINWKTSSNAQDMQEFNLTFQKPIRQSTSTFQKSQEYKSYLYDHPPSTGSYCASSEIDALSQYNTNTSKSIPTAHVEPLYHEIPSNPEYSVPKRNHESNKNLQECLYMNTTCHITKF